MASPIAPAIAGRPSFAKVAAMAPPQKVVKGPTIQTKATDLQKSCGTAPPAPNTFPSTNVVPVSANTSISQHQARDSVAAITYGVDKLEVKGEAASQHSPTEPSKVPGPVASTTEDDRSHLSNSSTKRASFDTKSMASENTFALDEKESLRPDDSASVQAADEEEPFFVPPTTSRPDPQMPLEGGNLGLRRPLHDGPIPVSLAARRFPMAAMANLPRFGEIMPGVPPCFPQNVAPTNPVTAKQNGVEPLQQCPAIPMPLDERLIEAMGTPKDRLLLLQLEEKFLAFITQSKDLTLDLPPQNSYERLLAHKLADYYNLARYSSTDSNSIRLYKAVEFRLPTPLSELVREIGGRDALPNGPTAVKIMRRTAMAANKVSNDGSTAASSSAPSKATSEAGAETTSDEGLPSPPNVTSSKDRSKLTREEKEAHYKAARERIFRDFQEAHGSENSTADTSANMSRSSSSSGKKKGHKQKAPRDDSFEARSSYVPGFPGMSHSAQNQYNGPYGVSGYQSPYGAQTPNPMPAMTFGSATPAYNQYDPSTTFPGTNFSSSYPNQYGSNDGWSNPQSPQPGGYYNFGQQPASSYSQYVPAMSPPVNQYPQIASPEIQSPGQQWAPIQYQQPFQAQPPMQAPMAQNGGLVSWPGYPPQANSHMQGGPYQYGQGPFQQYPSTPPPNHPHPLPGSYNRPAFNPQTRSFVPAGPNMRFGGQANQVRPAIPPFSGQASISSQNAEKPDSGARATSAPNKTQESLQKKWGTPAHLPKKPPPSQVPSTFEIENTPPLPSQQSFSPLVSSIVKVSPPVGNN